jgi:hypothetical protein
MLTTKGKSSVRWVANNCFDRALILTVCARVVHGIDISDLQVIRLPVFTGKEDDGTVLEEQWKAVLVYPNGMRNVLAATEAHEMEWQAISVLLRMLQHDARKKLFGGSSFFE